LLDARLVGDGPVDIVELCPLVPQISRDPEGRADAEGHQSDRRLGDQVRDLLCDQAEAADAHPAEDENRAPMAAATRATPGPIAA
jgi:hypothetical protein